MTRNLFFLCLFSVALSYASSKNDLLKKQTQIDTLLNTSDYLVLGDGPAEIKVVKTNEAEHQSDYNELATYGDDVILGKNIDYMDVEIYRKYHPISTFEDYEVPVYEGALAEPDFSSNPSVKDFSDRIKEGCEEGINFAGHYTLIYWGCGTACQSGVIVDRKTGKIYDGFVTSLGSEFQKDSKMIIMNVGALDKDTNLIEVSSYGEVTQEVWTDSSFNKIE